MALDVGQVQASAGLNTHGFMAGIDAIYKEGSKVAGRVGREFQQLGTQMSRVGRTLTMRLTAPIVGFGALALKTAGGFEASMNRVAAISGATESQLKQLESQARDLGATTQFSASQAADAMTFLSMAGFDVNQTMTAMPAVLNLAAAAQVDMARAADIASNIMQGFNMEAGDLGNAVDVMAKTFTSANTDLEQLGEGMKMVAPVAAGFGVRFEEVSAAVGFLSDAGLQATMAGTGLRRVLSTLSREADRLGIEVWDSSGNMRAMADIIEDLEAKGMTAAQAMDVFGERGGPAMQVLLSRGSDALRDMTGELENAGGTAEEIAEKQMEGLNGALKELRSAFEEMQIAIADSGLLDFVTDFAKGLTGVIRNIGQLNPVMLKWGTILATSAALIGPLTWAIGGMNKMVGSLILGLKAATAGQIALNTAMKANIFLAVAAGIGFIIERAISARRELNELRDEIKEIENLELSGTVQEFDRVSEAIKDTREELERARFDQQMLSWASGLFGVDKRVDELTKSLEGMIALRQDISGMIGDLSLMDDIPELGSGALLKLVQVTDDAGDSADDAVASFDNLRKTIAAIRPPDIMADDSAIVGLDKIYDSIIDITPPQIEIEPFLSMDTIGGIQRVYNNLEEQLTEATTQAERDRIMARMESLQEQEEQMRGHLANTVDMVSMSTRMMADLAVRFTDSFGRGMANVVVQGEKLVDVLKNIGKLLLSSAIQTGLKMLMTSATGGTSGFLGKAFAGVFHSGGVVGGQGDKMAIVKGGEGIFTPQQMSAMGGSGKARITIRNVMQMDERTVWEANRNFEVSL